MDNLADYVRLLANEALVGLLLGLGIISCSPAFKWPGKSSAK